MIKNKKVSKKLNIQINLNFFEALTIVFVVAKFMGVLMWPWGIVLAPVWAGATYHLLNYWYAERYNELRKKLLIKMLEKDSED